MLTIFLFVLCSAFSGYGQQQAFSSVALNNIQGRSIISFTIPREVNVRHYRVEASNDNVNFDIIATFLAKGNTPVSCSYNYDVSAYSYKYYRIGMVYMNGSMPYSGVVTETEDGSFPGPEMKPWKVKVNSKVLASH